MSDTAVQFCYGFCWGGMMGTSFAIVVGGAGPFHAVVLFVGAVFLMTRPRCEHQCQ